MKISLEKLIVFVILSIVIVFIIIELRNNNFTQSEKNETISDTIENKTNIKPQLPEILPNEKELSQSLYNSNLAILCMYFIEVLVYLYKQTPNKLIYNDGINTENILNLVNQFLPKNAKVVELLTYTCEKNLNTYYGGFIIEYNINNIITSFIVLRGTQESCEWGEDFKLELINPEWLSDLPNVKVHTGINNIYTLKKNMYSLRDQIWNYINKNIFTNLIITGHSVGGGICYLLAADITKNMPLLRNNLKIFSFAGPYTGNDKFVDLILSSDTNPNYSGIFSIINTQDSVPNTKFSEYQRIPVQIFCFSSYGNIFKKSSVHFPETYMKELKNNAKLFDSNASSKTSCGIQCSKFSDKQKIFITIIIIIIVVYLVMN